MNVAGADIFAPVFEYFNVYGNDTKEGVMKFSINEPLNNLYDIYGLSNMNYV
jgi:hypothetical protein